MSMPTNGEEAAYAAFATVDELLGLLIREKVLSVEAVNAMLESVSDRLGKAGNYASNRAALLISKRER